MKTDFDLDYESGLEENLETFEELVTLRLTENHRLFQDNEWDSVWGDELLVFMKRTYTQSNEEGSEEISSWELYQALDSFDEDRTNEIDRALELDIIERCNKKYK